MTHQKFFRKYYTKSIFWASISFGSCHGLEEFLLGMKGIAFSRVDLSAFIVLVPFEVLQSIFFFCACWIVSYLPVKVIYINHFYKGRKSFTLWGVFIAILSLPLCASFAYFILPLPDAPSYWGRCLEFAVPMMVAGLIGGNVFWREAGSREAGGSVAHPFL
jgi:hypothetical protein